MMLDLLQEIYATVMRNKLRTALTGFAVAWGIFMLIVLMGAGNGLINAFERQASTMAMNSIKVYPGRTSRTYKGLEKNRRISLDESDRGATARAFPRNVISTGASASVSDVSVTHGTNRISITLEGVLPNHTDLDPMSLKRGRFINKRDIEERRKVMVLHEKTAAMLFPRSEPIGKTVRAGGVVYKVVGIYSDQNAFRPSALVPLTTTQLLYNKQDSIDNITFTTRHLITEAENDTFTARYRTMMGGRKQFDSEDASALWIWNRFKQQLQQAKAARYLRIAVWVIGVFTLLSGIVGVSNIMLITVRERTHEFGIRKALGAKPSSILTLIVTESVAITTFFGYIGMLAGVAATEYLDHVAGHTVMDAGLFQFTFFEDPTVDISVAIEATLTLIVAGTLAGLFPAHKAAKILPIEALNAVES